MRALAITVALLCALSSWAQSLGDLVRADRERTKPRARRVITNDNLNEVANKDVATGPATAVAEEPPDGLSPDLHQMKVILRNICADPRTEEGRVLSNDDKKAMLAGIKVLRDRVEEFERMRKKSNDALAALNQDFEAKIVKAANTGKPFSDADLQRVKALWLEHDARRATLERQAEREMEDYKSFQQQVDTVGGECPAATTSVPD